MKRAATSPADQEFCLTGDHLRPAVYLDHNATTPLEPAVLEAMLPYLGGGPDGCPDGSPDGSYYGSQSCRFGNPSSRHAQGRFARAALDQARQQVAAAVGAQASEVVFVSGGTEANNMVLHGWAVQSVPSVLAISAIEHPSVREPAKALQKRLGWQLRTIAVDQDGVIDEADYTVALRANPQLVSVMFANNETGVVQDIGRLAQSAQARGAVFHSDAVQALGKVEFDFRELNRQGVQAMSLSAHKIGGPKGMGALLVDKRLDLAPLLTGGGQERGLRSGTENLPAIVGFGVACEIAKQRVVDTISRLRILRDELERGLIDLGAVLFGAAAPQRLANTVFFGLPDIDGETLVGKLDEAGFAVASGAACSSASLAPSSVLLAMGVAPGLARGAVRLSMGSSTTAKQIFDFLQALKQAVFHIKRLAVVAS